VADLASGLAQVLLLVHVDVNCECYYLRATTTVCVVCFFFYSSLVSPFSYSGRSVARQQLLANSLRLDNRVLEWDIFQGILLEILVSVALVVPITFDDGLL